MILHGRLEQALLRAATLVVDVDHVDVADQRRLAAAAWAIDWGGGEVAVRSSTSGDDIMVETDSVNTGFHFPGCIPNLEA